MKKQLSHIDLKKTAKDFIGTLLVFSDGQNEEMYCFTIWADAPHCPVLQQGNSITLLLNRQKEHLDVNTHSGMAMLFHLPMLLILCRDQTSSLTP